MPPARQQQSIAPCSEPERWGLPNHTLPALVASLTGSRPESAKSSPESPVVAPGKSGGHAGNLGYFRGNFGSCGRVGGRSPGHFRHLLCSFRALCLVAGVAVIDHGPSGRLAPVTSEISPLSLTRHPRTRKSGSARVVLLGTSAKFRAWVLGQGRDLATAAATAISHVLSQDPPPPTRPTRLSACSAL